jgi:hypothetical protein
MTLQEIRAANARQMSLWFEGKAKNPHGLSGHRWVVHPLESKNMWDTHPSAWMSSEWAQS